MLSQREGVYAAVTSFFKEKGILFEDGMKVNLSKDDRSTVIEMISSGIMSGSIVFSEGAKAKHSTQSSIRGYSSNLLSNWLRRDERLNGNVEYKPEKPGSRFGIKDDIIKNLRALAKSTTNEAELKAVEEAILSRQEELRSQKLKAKHKVNSDLLPENLRHLAK